MIDIIDRRLKQEGYRFLKVRPQEAGVYYRYAGGVTQVVVGLNGHDRFEVSGEQIELLRRNLRDLFLHPQGRLEDYPADTAIYDVQVLVLVVTKRPERYKEICGKLQYIWIYDISRNRLLIYENQPGDFYGLAAVMQEVSSAGELREQSGGASKRDWRRIPVISLALAAVNVAVFLILMLQGDTEDPLFMLEHGAMYPDLILKGGEWHRLVTCMFLHFGPAHLMNNMLMLVVAGMQLERALGKIKFLLLYLLSGLGSSLLSLAIMLRTGEIAVSAGASGAVFGIIGALLWVAIRNRGRFENLTTRGLIFMIALSLYFGFTSTGIDNWGHIGGVISGFLLSILLYWKQPDRRRK